MSAFAFNDGVLFAEDIALPDIALRFGTPSYVYSRAALTSALSQFSAPLAGKNALVCYAAKANSNLAILNLFARLGAGFDIVSGGELVRVLAAGGEPGKIVFSGVGKGETEISQALAAGIRCFNVESESELFRLDRIAGDLRRVAPIALRVNPDVDPNTHPYISTGLHSNKFGIAIEDAMVLYRKALSSSNLKVAGVACHIGSQLLDPAPMVEAADKVIALADTLAQEGVALQHLDLGGGFGIRYREETAPTIGEFLAPLLDRLQGRREQLLFEPGRSLVGNAGILLTRVRYVKRGRTKNFVIVDAAMNDLIRPALYDAWHDIVSVTIRQGPETISDVVGPVCESGDFIGLARPLAVAEGDLLAVLSAGAYAMSMSSNYNSRPRPAEVMVDGAGAYEVRRREQEEELVGLESVLP
jgi:diaminopimelate decarboxylase